MVERTTDLDGLTPKQAQFATLIATGWTGADAYRAAYDSEDCATKSVWELASRERAKINVASRIKTLLGQARLQDLDSVGQAINRSLELVQEAREHKNYSAAAKVNSDLLKLHGLLRDSLVVSFESSLTDDQLMARLAGDDPILLEAARKLLRAPNSFAQIENDPTVIDVPAEQT